MSIREANLVRFLREELAIAPASIDMALRHEAQERGPLAMILWRYGLITREQLDQIFAWLSSPEAL